MSLIDFVWYLNITDETKYIVFIGFFVIVLIYCIYNGKKKTNNVKRFRKAKTKCQRNYNTCVRNNITNGTNNYCFPCSPDGSPINFVYDPQQNQLYQNPN